MCQLIAWLPVMYCDTQHRCCCYCKEYLILCCDVTIYFTVYLCTDFITRSVLQCLKAWKLFYCFWHSICTVFAAFFDIMTCVMYSYCKQLAFSVFSIHTVSQKMTATYLYQLELVTWTNPDQYSLFLVCNILVILASKSIYNFPSNLMLTLLCNFSG